MSIPSFPRMKPQFTSLRIRSYPLSVYEKLYQREDVSFMYESLESKGERGRYSFIGAKPFMIFKSKGEHIEIDVMGRIHREKGNPVHRLSQILLEYTEYPDLSPFCGGAVGYVAYDAVRFFEDIPDENNDEMDTPDCYFIFPSEIIIFDYKEEVVHIILYADNNHKKRLEELRSIVETCTEDTVFQPGNARTSLPFESNFTEESFCEIVKKAKAYIYSGDIFQAVLSQRLKCHVEKEPIHIYKALRTTNPSPYMVYLRLDDLSILGSSPEVLVKLIDGLVTTRPLAGTRPRGRTEEEDRQFEEELLNDEKERAEHIMLVDLARNDIGRVCQYGSVKVTKLLEIEKYSKVMHIVSNVEGHLLENKDAFDVLRAAFPAGTVSGAPKIRAMEVIDELEPTRRGIYAGAIGYFSFSGNMDTCITIRTIVLNNKTGYVQAGAGIVADSVPEKEYLETLNKASALKKAIEIAK